VFLSYLSSDRGRVLPIARELEKIGVHVWIDMFSIPAGANYGLTIAEGIQHCSVVLVACSPAALQSRNVKQEIQLAWKHQRPYLPLLLEPTIFPQEIEYWLEGYQWVEILDRPQEEWLPRVIQSLKKLGIPTTYTSAAPVVAEKQALIEPALPVDAPRPAQSAPPIAPAAVAPAANGRTPSVGKRVTWPVAAAAAVLVLAVAAALVLFIAPWRGDNSPGASSNTPSVGGAPPSNASTGAPGGETPNNAALQPGLPGAVPIVPTTSFSATRTPANPTLSVPVMPMGS
jgi:hypothetical protein